VSSFVIECLPPTQPPMECRNTNIFGAPRSRPGRILPFTTDDIPVSAVAVHCLKDSFEGYIGKACTGLTKIPVECHASMHYIVDAETGAVASLVHEEDVAWAWQSYRSNFPVTSPVDSCPCPDPCPQPPCPVPFNPQTYPGWPVLSAEFPNIAADFYTINIGVTRAQRPEDAFLDNMDCCTGPYGMTEKAYRVLVQLIAWIDYRYDAITTDAQHIAFHDEVIDVDPACLECPCGANGACLVCDVSRYCQKCTNVSPPQISEGTTLRWVFGEASTGCLVKISLADFKTLLGL